MTQPHRGELERAIHEALAHRLADLGVRPDLSLIRSETSVADGTTIYNVGRGNERAVLLISPATFPSVVAEDQTKAAQMCRHLGEDLGSVIIGPLAQGNLLGRSYALLPFHRTFSDNPLAWSLQKSRLKYQLMEWLHTINEQHRVAGGSAEHHNHFRYPLELLNTMMGVESDIRAAAATALNRLLSGKFTPCVVPMHNDIWKGNILRSISGSKKKYSFVVIDWRGSRIDGYPIYDLVRASLSFKLSSGELHGELARATRALDCDPSDARSYMLAALGEIAMRLGQFPSERFAQLARHCFAEVQKAKIETKEGSLLNSSR